MDKPRRVFLSTSTSDESLREAVTRNLQQGGINVWSDRDIVPGQSWVDSVGKAVRDSEAFVVLMTPAWENSRHGLAELGFVMSEQQDTGKPLIPVQVTDAQPLLLQKDFAFVDGRGLQPREVAERVRQAIDESLGHAPAAAV